MGKVIMFNLVTLNGYFEGLNQDISWHQVDDEFNEFAIEQLSSTDETQTMVIQHEPVYG
jgi:hypothetical protein